MSTLQIVQHNLAAQLQLVMQLGMQHDHLHQWMFYLSCQAYSLASSAEAMPCPARCPR